MLTISTLPEAIGVLSEKTGRAWSESESFDAATWLRIHLHAPVPEGYKTTVLSMKPEDILEEKYCLGPGHSLLAVLFPIHVARLLISGTATTWHLHDGDLQADERKFLTEGLLVTRADVRVKAAALSKILEGWENVQKGLFWYACPKWMLPPVTSQSDQPPQDDTFNLSEIYSEQAREKAAAGRYNLEEAAKLISLSGEASDEQMLVKFVAAAASGKLATYMPGRSARNDYGAKIGRFKEPNTFYDECYCDELNEWLIEFEPRIVFRFPKPSTADFGESSDVYAASAPSATAERGDAPAWALKKPQRYQGYGKPLYDILKIAHREGAECPSARDVLDAFKLRKPPEVIEVMSDGIKYYDSKGDSKPADLRAIEKAIGRLVEHGPDSAD